MEEKRKEVGRDSGKDAENKKERRIIRGRKEIGKERKI